MLAIDPVIVIQFMYISTYPFSLAKDTHLAYIGLRVHWTFLSGQAPEIHFDFVGNYYRQWIFSCFSKLWYTDTDSIYFATFVSFLLFYFSAKCGFRCSKLAIDSFQRLSWNKNPVLEFGNNKQTNTVWDIGGLFDLCKYLLGSQRDLQSSLDYWAPIVLI